MKNINKKEEKKRTRRIQPPAGPTISQARRCGPSPRRRWRRIKRDEWWLDIENTRRRSGHGIGKKRYKTIKWRNKRERELAFQMSLFPTNSSLWVVLVYQTHMGTQCTNYTKRPRRVFQFSPLFFSEVVVQLCLFFLTFEGFFSLGHLLHGAIRDGRRKPKWNKLLKPSQLTG